MNRLACRFNAHSTPPGPGEEAGPMAYNRSPARGTITKRSFASYGTVRGAGPVQGSR